MLSTQVFASPLRDGEMGGKERGEKTKEGIEKKTGAPDDVFATHLGWYSFPEQDVLLPPTSLSTLLNLEVP